MKELLVCFLGMMLFCTANAEILDFPASVAMGEKPAEITFRVTNGSSAEQSLAVEVYAPAASKIEAPASLGAGESAEVKIRFEPNAALAGSRYTGTVVVKLGAEKWERALEMQFAASGGAGAGSEGSIGAAFVGLFALPWGELALDLLLAAIASILLIMFISRMAKRVATASIAKPAQQGGKRAGSALEPEDAKLESLKDRIAGQESGEWGMVFKGAARAEKGRAKARAEKGMAKGKKKGRGK